jgi:predicted transcriptional regulator
MRTKRVEVLFEPKEYSQLEQVARVKRRSVGSLVREAVAKYVTGPEQKEKRKALEWMAAQRGPVGSPEEIKAAILADIDEGIKRSLETD